MNCNGSENGIQSVNKASTDSMLRLYHSPTLYPNQCTSRVVQLVHAPLPLVWSIVRRFDYPQAYKQFVKTCIIRDGDGGVGTIRELLVVTGMPANTSVERLDRLDDDAHLMVFTIIGGDHQLLNYRSTTTLHEVAPEEAEGGGRKTVVVESYVVDVPSGSSKEDTVLFADTIIKCNLKWLARVAETIR
ncbi:abscisic acid receptor PYL12-like [Cucurbita moschata]|uniref:Abscisic acid receptor PYL12-like n=1 Tax=Cucurbita moschata TaxID=3662 RepID=A0A6J1GR38_CUCMO|nr:abscisic acid receptor PYL12-like [Cucurbita moschata]